MTSQTYNGIKKTQHALQHQMELNVLIIFFKWSIDDTYYETFEDVQNLQGRSESWLCYKTEEDKACQIQHSFCQLTVKVAKRVFCRTRKTKLT